MLYLGEEEAITIWIFSFQIDNKKKTNTTIALHLKTSIQYADKSKLSCSLLYYQQRYPYKCFNFSYENVVIDFQEEKNTFQEEIK